MAAITIDFAKCIGCGTCADVCPASCYGDVVDGKITVVADEECIFCRSCESQCPEACIVIAEQ
jgi:NAD-dependent dihydropyrimidine dehydrogenase PreA subunit